MLKFQWSHLKQVLSKTGKIIKERQVKPSL